MGHRGHDPDAYDDKKADSPVEPEPCPFCGKPVKLLPDHLPCDGVEGPAGPDRTSQ